MIPHRFWPGPKFPAGPKRIRSWHCHLPKEACLQQGSIMLNALKGCHLSFIDEVRARGRGGVGGAGGVSGGGGGSMCRQQMQLKVGAYKADCQYLPCLGAVTSVSLEWTMTGGNSPAQQCWMFNKVFTFSRDCVYKMLHRKCACKRTGQKA